MGAINERQFDTGTVSINYAEVGAGGPLLLLHGGSSRWQSLERLARQLAPRWRVYAPDLRGHGHSGRTPGRYRLADYADDIVTLLERVTGTAYIFGHSLGGEVALTVAARRPDLVRALAVGDTPLSASSLRQRSEPSRPMLALWRDLAASGDLADDIADALREMVVPDFEGRTGRAEDLMGHGSPWFAFMASCLRDLDPTMLDAVIEFDEMHSGYEAGRLLPRIACPVLLIQGDPSRGGALPDDDVALARTLLTDVREALIDGAGHALYIATIGDVLVNFFRSIDVERQ